MLSLWQSFRVGVLSIVVLRALPAQSTFATITGTVTDPNGAVVPGASVVATESQTNYKYAARSNEVGQYTVAQLHAGSYTLTATAAGFKEFVVNDILLMARDQRRLDVKLEVGGIETKIQVTGGPTLIETETARISDFQLPTTFTVLPFNSRMLWEFLGMLPGVQQSTDGSWRRFSGSRKGQSSAAMDGITLDTLWDGTQMSPLIDYPTSYQEVRVDLANNSAEFSAVGQVTIITKSGTNQLHGAVWDYYKSAAWDARNFFAPPGATGITHWPGGSIGGPIVLPKIYNGRDKTFFFSEFDTMRGSTINQYLYTFVPLTPWRTGDFSNLATQGAPGAIVKDPFDGNTPFPGNKIPTSRINPVAQKIQDRFYSVTPNFGPPDKIYFANYLDVQHRPVDPRTTWTTRIDHRFSDKSSIFGRFTWNRTWYTGFSYGLASLGRDWDKRDQRNLGVSYTRTIRPNLINEFRWGLAFNNEPRNGAIQGKQWVQELGLQGLAPDLPDINGIYQVSFSGSPGITGLNQLQWRHPGFELLPMQFQEQLSWFRGRHNFKIGYMPQRVWYADDRAASNLFGSGSFTNRFTGFNYADFLLGIPTSASRAFPPLYTEAIRWGHDFFVMDDFKVSSRLTLNLGLRYEYHPVPYEIHGLESIFDIASGKIVIPDASESKVNPLMPTGYVGVITASQAGLPKTLIRTDKNNFAPRVGLAYRPFGSNTVFRAGFGVFYDTVPQAPSIPIGGGVPFLISEPGFTNPAGVPSLVLPQAFPATGTGGPSSVGLPTAVNPNLRIPYSMQYNFTMEHQRWDTGFRISYIGTNTRQGIWAYDINQPLPDTRPYVSKPRMFPQYSGISYLTNGAGHQYNGLTLEAQRQIKQGFLYQFSYVLSRDIGDLENSQSPENAYDRKRERAVWGDIPTHRIAGNFVYDLPLGRGKHFFSGARRPLEWLVGGWEMSGIYQLNSGQFLTPSWSGPDPTGTRFSGNATPAFVGLRPNCTADPNLPSDQRSLSRWFNTAAFAAPPPGSFGTCAKGVIKGPGISILHAGIAKYFELTERVRLRGDMIASNALNHPTWTNPGTDITNPSALGRITFSGAQTFPNLDSAGQRMWRMSVRLEW